MFNLRNEPFSYLPFGDNELFDLTCEYCISQLEKIQINYNEIIVASELIINNLPNLNSDQYRICLGQVEYYLENYSKLVKSVKLSIGENVGTTESKQTILDKTHYNPNSTLQYDVIHGLRNTSQHFEERLQTYINQVDPFLKLYYEGQQLSWAIIFGNGGYKFSGSQNSSQSEHFDITKLSFQSYKQSSNRLITVTISIQEIWKDTFEIYKLFERNIESARQIKGASFSNIRELSVFISPDKPDAC